LIFATAYPRVSVHAQLTAAAMCERMPGGYFTAWFGGEWCAVGGPLFLVGRRESKNLERFCQQQLANARRFPVSFYRRADVRSRNRL